MGPDNLMVLLTVDRRYRQHAYVFNEASGIWDPSGIWYERLPRLAATRPRADVGAIVERRRTRPPRARGC
jgi:hypothetical protein